jgi:predicted nucleic acid-binding protein
VILCDVGVLLQAMIRQTAHHKTCRRELERLRANRRMATRPASAR